MSKRKTVAGHVLAALAQLMWGTTFVASKVLLRYYTPAQILMIRAILAIIAMYIACPHIIKFESLKKEILFALAGLTGITIYFLLENTALTYTYASNVGIIVACAPFFVALACSIFFDNEKISKKFIIGFFLAITGIAIVSLNGQKEVGLNPLGDMMAVFAMVSWGLYSTIVKKIDEWGYNPIMVTRRIFIYAVILLIPALLIQGETFDLNSLVIPRVAGNFLFLGIFGSAIGFITWNYCTRVIGAIKTSVYVYLSPITTLLLSAIILHEKLTLLSVFGIILIFTGLIIAQNLQELLTKD